MNLGRMHQFLVKSFEDPFRADIWIMMTKWRILWQPLQVNLKFFGNVFMCITRFHSFCVNERCVVANNSDKIRYISLGFIPSDISVTNNEENSVLCDIIIEELAQRSLERPAFNYSS